MTDRSVRTGFTRRRPGSVGGRDHLVRRHLPPCVCRSRSRDDDSDHSRLHNGGRVLTLERVQTVLSAESHVAAPSAVEREGDGCDRSFRSQMAAAVPGVRASLCGGARWWPPGLDVSTVRWSPRGARNDGCAEGRDGDSVGFLFGDSWGMRVFGRVHVRRPRRFVPPWVHGVRRLWNGGRATWIDDGIVVPGIRRASHGSKYCAQT